MKKLFIYYYVGGFTDTYFKIEVIEAKRKKMLYRDIINDIYYFSRNNDTSIERVFGLFNSKNDPLLTLVENERHAYFMEEETNENNY